MVSNRWALVRWCVGFGRWAPLAVLLAELFNDDLRENGAELPDVSSECDNLSDETAARECILIARHNEHRLHLAHGTVGQRQLKLVAQVGDVANAAQDRRRFGMTHEIDGEPGVL